MAQHIDSVRDSSIPKASKAQFYASLRPGDLVFCWGDAAISKGIEGFTGGPSHVLKVWTASWAGEWLTFEATIEAGVHYGRFAHYADGGDGDLVLCRRPALTPAQLDQEMRNSVQLIGQRYDWIEFGSLVARRIWPDAPLIQPAHELFCSGAQEAIALNTVPFTPKQASWKTPEELYVDASVGVVCALRVA